MVLWIFENDLDVMSWWLLLAGPVRKFHLHTSQTIVFQCACRIVNEHIFWISQTCSTFYNLTSGGIYFCSPSSFSCHTVRHNALIRKVNTTHCIIVINAHVWLFSPSYHGQFSFLHYICCSAWKHLSYSSISEPSSLFCHCHFFLFSFFPIVSIRSLFLLDFTVHTATILSSFSISNSSAIYE